MVRKILRASYSGLNGIPRKVSPYPDLQKLNIAFYLKKESLQMQLIRIWA